MKKIYLDYAATTATDLKVIEKIAEVSGKIYGNAGSLHSEGGWLNRLCLALEKILRKF